MQLGFVIDHSRCIGCHACTVACKSENDVPVGSFRTWVKYTEQGQFPEVKRSFAVLRCNQCTSAPCVTICPVKALGKGANGIVDIDPQACIGCKSCMQACPYDALYINEGSGLAEKCHFCAHRVEVGLAPACAVVCPTEAIIPGDFHDPESRVSQLRKAGDLQARKTEAGTGPNVFYREVTEAGIDPALTNGAGGYLWANQVPGAQLDAETFEALERKAEARTTYDVPHASMWGWKVGAYLLTKSVAAGAFLASMVWIGSAEAVSQAMSVAAATGLLFLALTLWLLVADLKRPERFLFILLRPNWDSWLVRGGVILSLYGLFLVLWLTVAAWDWIPTPALRGFVVFGTVLLAALSAIYTGWLFGQAKGRVLWLWKPFVWHLLVQALVAGAAILLVLTPVLDLSDGQARSLRWLLLGSLLLHALFTRLKEHVFLPPRREAEYLRAVRLITHGPFARRHVWLGLVVGMILPALLVTLWPAGAPLAGLLALVGLWSEEDVFVRAGQALPIS